MQLLDSVGIYPPATSLSSLWTMTLTAKPATNQPIRWYWRAIGMSS